MATTFGKSSPRSRGRCRVGKIVTEFGRSSPRLGGYRRIRRSSSRLEERRRVREIAAAFRLLKLPFATAKKSPWHLAGGKFRGLNLCRRCGYFTVTFCFGSPKMPSAIFCRRPRHPPRQSRRQLPIADVDSEGCKCMIPMCFTNSPSNITGPYTMYFFSLQSEIWNL